MPPTNLRSAADIYRTAAELRRETRAALEDLDRRTRELDEMPDWKREPDAERILYRDRRHLVEGSTAIVAEVWRAARAVVMDARAAHTDALRRQDRDVSPRRAAAIADDLRSRLSLVQPSFTDPAQKLRALEKLVAEAELSGDANQLRAVRVAGAEVVNGPGGEADARLRETITRRLQGIADAERAEVAAAEAEVRESEHALGALRLEVIRTGERITGTNATSHGAPHGWASEVLGERPAYDGGVIEDAAA